MPSSQQSRSRRGTQSKPNSRTATSSSSAEPIIDADQDTDSESSEPEYEVEELRDHRRVGGKLQFFVKWKGYSEAEKTWEPESNITSTELVDAYWSKTSQNKQAQKKSKRTSSTAATNQDADEPSSSSRPRPRPDMRGGYLPPGEQKQRQSETKKDDDMDLDAGAKYHRSTDANRHASDEGDDLHDPEAEEKARTKYERMKNWDDVVVKVHTIERSDDGELLAFLDFEDGWTLIYPTAIANKKCPQKLLRFYEENLKFRDPPKAEP